MDQLRVCMAMLAVLMATAGCKSMGATAGEALHNRATRPHNSVVDWPLDFVQHSYGAFCYSTYGCRVGHGARLEMKNPEDLL